MRHGHTRSAASRAYYAVFAAVTAALLQTRQLPGGARGTWPHKVLPDMVRNHLIGRLGHGKARDNRRLTKVSYSIRIIADYRPGLSIDEGTAHRAVADAATVLRYSEVSG